MLLGLAIHRAAYMHGEPVNVTRAGLGVDLPPCRAQTWKHAIRRLVTARLIRVERERGQAFRAWVIRGGAP